MSAKDKQVGGEHYKDMPIQLAEFVIPNKIGYYPSSVIKRMCRYNKPTGKGLEDLEKAKHEIDLIIEIEGWDKNNVIDVSKNTASCECSNCNSLNPKKDE